MEIKKYHGCLNVIAIWIIIVLMIFIATSCEEDCKTCVQDRYDNSHNLSITDVREFEYVNTAVFATLCGNSGQEWSKSLGTVVNPVIQTDNTGISWVLVGRCE